MKHRLLETVAAARARESELASICVDSPPDPEGRWRAKDHLAHLAAWRSNWASQLETVRAGGELSPSVDEDAENARIYALNRDRPAADIRAEAVSSWDRFAAAIDACSDADLLKPHPIREGVHVWEMATGNGHEHLGQHLMFWYLGSSEEAAAESSQLWVYELNRGVFSEPRQRAHSAYNLACFYGRVGRPGKAVPLLRESFKGMNDLVKLARKDPDLDPIRDDPQLRELLG